MGYNSTKTGPEIDAGVATAWVNFDENGNIISSYNVTSVTKSSTGTYDIVLTSMDNINYAITGSPLGSVANRAVGFYSPTSPTTFQVWGYTISTSEIFDVASSVVIFGGKD